ncbi:hypothetical protein ACFXJ8_04045 [Nonomuraea sp. NPDC059194]|uniref:hypothetical protein n=1 Tax=Nonomuraea sp. NPDC059194 TaxID=3346764 RepID=UPI0036B23407
MSWNQDDPPPTNPYRAPDWQSHQFQQVPTMPSPPPQPPKRRSWVLPTVAAGAAVVLIAGGAGAFLLYGKPAKTTSGDAASPATSQSATPSPTRPVMDVCAMLPAAEAERLVPAATVDKRSREADYAVYSYCDWSNRRISHGEFWRSREIKVSIAQHKPDGPSTGRAEAQQSFESERGFFNYKAKNQDKPDEPGEKNYNSPVRDYAGVGDGAAFGQYTWRRDKLLWYSFGEGRVRVDDLVIEVRYQASQQRKDAKMLSNEGTQSISEENALREVGLLLTHLAKSAAEWKKAHPGQLAHAEPSPSPSATPTAAPTPAPTPSSSPTVMAQLPPACKRMTPAMIKLVPGATERARANGAAGMKETECRWLNLNVPAGEGRRRIRSVLLTIQVFSNRAGAGDPTAALSNYSTKLGGARFSESSGIGGVTWGKIEELKGLGDAAYVQYRVDKKNTVFNGSADVVVRLGPTVIQASYAGSDLGADEPTNSPKVKVLGEKEARDGAMTVAREILASLAKAGLKND